MNQSLVKWEIYWEICPFRIDRFFRLFSSLETFSQHFSIRELEQSFTHQHFTVSIVNIPTHRPKPIVGFAFGSFHRWSRGFQRVEWTFSDSTTNQTFPLTTNETRNSSTTIQLSPQALIDQNRLVFSVFDPREGLFNSDEDDHRSRLLTRVFSLTVDQPETTKNLGPFVQMNFYLENQFRGENIPVKCVYWHINDDKSARWSTDGCQLIDYDQEYIRCQCDHLTHFAILMVRRRRTRVMKEESVFLLKEITPMETPKAVEQILSLMTWIGLSLSSFGLCLTILTFLLFK